MKATITVLVAFLPLAQAAEDGPAFLAKARSAYLENRQRAKYWNWTTVEKRAIVDKSGKVLEELPSVTIESPIRADGRRCNAVLAWGDGQPPYLLNASADERCVVEQEVKQVFELDALLESRRVKVERRSGSAIVLSIAADRQAAISSDEVARCIASVKATIHLDPATYFPKQMRIALVDSGCEQRVGAVNHYGEQQPLYAFSTLRKGATLQFEYELQHSKSGNPRKDYWVATRRHSIRPLRNGASSMIYWGRRVPTTSQGSGRYIRFDTTTAASELSTDTLLRFETEKDFGR